MIQIPPPEFLPGKRGTTAPEKREWPGLREMRNVGMGKGECGGGKSGNLGREKWDFGDGKCGNVGREKWEFRRWEKWDFGGGKVGF